MHPAGTGRSSQVYSLASLATWLCEDSDQGVPRSTLAMQPAKKPSSDFLWRKERKEIREWKKDFFFERKKKNDVEKKGGERDPVQV